MKGSQHYKHGLSSVVCVVTTEEYHNHSDWTPDSGQWTMLGTLANI